MKAILSILWKEFIQLRRDPRLFPVIFISPVLQLLLLGYAANLDVKNIPTVVCDLDRSAAGRGFLDGFLNSGYFTAAARVDRLDRIDHYLDHGDAAMAIVIPRGFGDKIAAGRQAPVMIIADGSESQSASIGVNYATMIAARYAQKSVIEFFERAKGAGLRPGTINPELRVWYNPELKSRNFMVPGVLGLILMIMTTSLTSQGIVREREKGTMEQLIVTPVRPYQLIAGKLLPFVFIGIVQAIFVVAVARLLLLVPFRGSLALLLHGVPGLHAQHARQRTIRLDDLQDPAAGHADVHVHHHAPDHAQRVRFPDREHAPGLPDRDAGHSAPLFLRHHPGHHA